MLLSTAKVIFEAHMELTRRAEQCARTVLEPVRDAAQALPSWQPCTGVVAPEVVRTCSGELAAVSLRSYRNAGMLAIAARTCAADHTPPRGAEMPRSFNSFAIERSEFAPAVRMSSMIGARSAARDLAASDLARRPLRSRPPSQRDPGSRPAACRALLRPPGPRACDQKSSSLRARRQSGRSASRSRTNALQQSPLATTSVHQPSSGRFLLLWIGAAQIRFGNTTPNRHS
jgi:hypothetical protein